MTDPASPAAVTEDRIAEIRAWLEPDTVDPEPDFEERAVENVRDLLAAYDARGLELARVRAELNDAKRLVYVKSVRTLVPPPFVELVEALHERALAAEARLAQANEALEKARDELNSDTIEVVRRSRALQIIRAALSPTPPAQSAALKPGWLADDVKRATDRVAEWHAQSAGEALDPAGTGEDHIGDVNELIGKLDMIAKFETAPISVRDRCREAAALIRAQASALAEAKKEVADWQELHGSIAERNAALVKERDEARAAL